MPIDQVVFNFNVVDTIEDAKTVRPPKDGGYVRGVFLEGCRFSTDLHSLEPSAPKELFTEMPILWFLPDTKRQTRFGADRSYECPLYKVLSRAGSLSTTGHSTNFVIFVDLPTQDDPETWVKAGVALFLALRD